MDSSKPSRIDKLLMLFIIISLICGFYMLNKTNFKKLYSNNNSFSNANNQKSIESIIKNYEENYQVININYINDKITCLLTINEDGKYKSIIINNNNGNELQPDDLIISKSKEALDNKILDLLKVKYPKFIVDVINNGTGEEIYEFKNNELVIYYQNYVFDPEYNKEVSLRVNYNEIKDYLKFEYTLDPIYVNEDGYTYDPNKVTIALSFDDGPNGNNTEEIMTALEDNKMTATFFMVGNKMLNQADLVNKVYQSRNEIGSHTYSHINMKKVNINTVTNELNKTNEIFNSITGGSLSLVRPPYGAYTKDIIKNYENAFILWNVDTNDWRYKDVDYLVNHIMSHIEDGNIILMHDSYQTSVDTVKKVLPMLYVNDIQVVSVGTLAKMKNIYLESGQSYYSFQ